MALLALFVILYLLVAFGSRPTPHLGLDLEGGTQVTLQAQTDNGRDPSKSSLEQARTIIDNRVNGLGVANAQTVIQGSNQIVISVPGSNGRGLDSVSQAALLQFRPFLIQPIAETGSATASTSTTPTAGSTGSATATAAPSSSGAKASSASSSAAVSSSAAKSSAASSSATKTSATGSTSSSDSGQNAGAVRHEVAKAATSSTAASSSSAAKASSSATSTAKATGTVAASSSSVPAPTIFTAQPEGSAPVNQWAVVQKIAKQLGVTFTVPKTAADVTTMQTANPSGYALLQLAMQQWPCDNSTRPLDDSTMLSQPIITCGATGTSNVGYKYLLGPVVVQGKQVKSAQALAPGSQQGVTGWTVTLTLNGSGQKAWANFTSEHNVGVDSTDVETYVANTLDSQVIEYSQVQSTITGDTQISGSFNSTSANDLANQLKYGALPLSFKVLTDTSISATLGSSQLKAGLLAGGIGLALVVIYSLLYYRALGLVTIASLIVSGGLTYAMVVIFGNQIGFTLTLAGIAGFIVAVGITADSFVVFFERIKDEVREGRTARSAVPRAWNRALRTILSADFVSLLAAVILYWLASGDVRGFAFTLGLSTVLDLIVVVLFTHPLVSLLSRSDAFGNARFSGLNSIRRRSAEVALPGGGTVPVGGLSAGGPSRPRRSTGATAEERASQRRGGVSRQVRSPAVEPEPQEIGDEEYDDVEEHDVVEDDAGYETEQAAPVDDADEQDETVADDPAPEPPPARPAPVTGSTAAERAAARRARNRNTDGQGS